MLKEKVSHQPQRSESELRIAMSVEELESVLHELLAHISELRQPQHPYYLSVLGALLHLMTDLETQLALARATLEQERLIHNDNYPSSRYKTEIGSIGSRLLSDGDLRPIHFRGVRQRTEFISVAVGGKRSQG